MRQVRRPRAHGARYPLSLGSDLTPHPQSAYKPRMPTIVEPTLPSAKQVSKYFPNLEGRPKGSKNKRPTIQIRHELEQVYQRMGGFNGLLEYAQSQEGRPKFYEWVVKILASFELKETEKSSDPIKVLVYGADGSHIEIKAGGQEGTKGEVLGQRTAAMDNSEQLS